MLSGNPIGRRAGPGGAADWRNWLEREDLLTPGLRESYRRTLEGFGHFCLKRGASGTSAGGASAEGRRMVALAREWAELQRLERALGAVQLHGVICPLDF